MGQKWRGQRVVRAGIDQCRYLRALAKGTHESRLDDWTEERSPERVVLRIAFSNVRKRPRQRVGHGLAKTNKLRLACIGRAHDGGIGNPATMQ